MDEPVVSVVIPAYNMEGFIGQAIDSVLGQTYQQFEVIVVDDGSSDGTVRSAAQIADPRVRIITHTHQRGPSAARNTGIVRAGGDYIGFLDADDIWLPEKLEQQVELLSTRHALGFVYCGAHQVDSSLRFLRTPALGPPWPKAGREAFVRLFSREYFVVAPLSTMVLRRTCLDQVGLFDEAIVQGEELDLLLRLAQSWDIAFVPEPLVLYRVTGHFNPEKRLGRRIGEALETTITRAFERLPNAIELESLRVQALCNTHWKVALYHYAMRQPRQADIELDKIAATSPDYLDSARNTHLGSSIAYAAWGLYDTITPLKEALAFVDYAFDHFPPAVRFPKDARRRVKAEVGAITAFDSLPRGEAWRVWKATCLAVLLDPSLLRNRGLLKLPFRAVANRGPGRSSCFGSRVAVWS